jgi:hypothetical protein
MLLVGGMGGGKYAILSILFPLKYLNPGEFLHKFFSKSGGLVSPVHVSDFFVVVVVRKHTKTFHDNSMR